MNITIAALTAPANLNGVSRHAINVCRALLESPSISRVHLLLGKWQLDMLKQTQGLSDARLNVHALAPSNTSPGRLLWYYRDLPQIAKQLQSDILHFSCPAPVHSDAFGCPVVLSLHDLYPFEIPENFGPLKSWLARGIVRQAVHKADAIACVSESTRHALKQILPSEAGKAVVVPNAVSPLSCRASCRPAALPESQFVLCVAQHRANKNIPLALRIFKECIKRGILRGRAVLVIVGIEGPETHEIVRMVRRLDLQGNVLMLTGMHDAELRWCYEHCALLLAPSVTEGFGYPVAEAMMAGCPIVCSDIAAFREVGDVSCHFVPFGAGAFNGYVNAISRALQLDRPRPDTLPEYSIRAISTRLVDLYEKINCHANQRFAMLAEPNLESGAHGSAGR